MSYMSLVCKASAEYSRFWSQHNTDQSFRWNVQQTAIACKIFKKSLYNRGQKCNETGSRSTQWRKSMRTEIWSNSLAQTLNSRTSKFIMLLFLHNFFSPTHLEQQWIECSQLLHWFKQNHYHLSCLCHPQNRLFHNPYARVRLSYTQSGWSSCIAPSLCGDLWHWQMFSHFKANL